MLGIVEPRQKVFFYGNSLVLAGIRASLRDCPAFEAVTLDDPEPEVELHAFSPGVVIFDLGAIQPEFLLARLQAQPGLLLIGIDPESHEVLLTGQAARSISVDQLLQIVRSREASPRAT